MAKYRFTAAERWAVFKTHGGQCYICRVPIDMASFQVDHVIPESLLGQADRLTNAIRSLGRPDNFSINSFENWLPACTPCNNRKRALTWEPSLQVQSALQTAAAKADTARREAQRVVSNAKIGQALTVLIRAYETDTLTDEVKAQLQLLVLDYAQGHSPNSDQQVVRLTPNYAVPLFEILSDNGLVQVVRGPYGVGGGPTSAGRAGPSGMRCGVCGYQYFNGARCVICGTMDDGD